MATKIRFKRIGRRNRPFYRLIVIDSRKRRDGAPIEQLGWYDPIKADKESNFSFNEDKIIDWLNTELIKVKVFISDKKINNIEKIILNIKVYFIP